MVGPWPNREGTTVSGDILDQTDHSKTGRKKGFVGRGIQVIRPNVAVTDRRLFREMACGQPE